MKTRIDTSSFRGPKTLCFYLIENLFAMNCFVSGRVDAQLDLVTLDAQYGDDHIITHYQALPEFSTEYQHRYSPLQ
ncbi:MAG: hypothetical protein ACJAYC_002731 [Halieaceae bacterium]|jgi:hypothetical protein